MKRRDLEGRTMQRYLTLQKRIMRRLTSAGATGITRSELYRTLGSPITRMSMDIALNALRKRGKALARRIETGTVGRPKEVWWASTELPEDER